MKGSQSSETSQLTDNDGIALQLIIRSLHGRDRSRHTPISCSHRLIRLENRGVERVEQWEEVEVVNYIYSVRVRGTTTGEEEAMDQSVHWCRAR